MALRSELLRGDQKLEKAAVSHGDHIVPGARGAHVVRIQQALIQVAGAALEPDGVYGTHTAEAVAEFKRTHQPPILNSANQIDNIVGIKTLAALDAKLLAQGGRGGRLQLNFGLDVTLVDIVVNFIGAPGSSLQKPEEALPDALILKAYDPVPDPPDRKPARKLMRHKTTNNLLLRIAHNTTEIGPGKVAVFLAVLSSIATVLREQDPTNGNILAPGRVFVLGSSSGGRNAIDFVSVLVQSGFKPHFLAAIDASFFQTDTLDRPRSTKEPVEPIPTFNGPFAGVIPQVPNRHNFFQRRGNHAKSVLNPFSSEKLLFTSKMGGGLEEIHGQVQGFGALTPVPASGNHEIIATDAFGRTDENFHEFCDAEGRRQAQEMIATELRQGV
jgi:hypothetical protein